MHRYIHISILHKNFSICENTSFKKAINHLAELPTQGMRSSFFSCDQVYQRDSPNPQPIAVALGYHADAERKYLLAEDTTYYGQRT